MSTEKHSNFTVITNKELEAAISKTTNPAPNIGYQTNPFYERLVKFAGDSKRKRFTVEDLLR